MNVSSMELSSIIVVYQLGPMLQRALARSLYKRKYLISHAVFVKLLRIYYFVHTLIIGGVIVHIP